MRYDPWKDLRPGIAPARKYQLASLFGCHKLAEMEELHSPFPYEARAQETVLRAERDFASRFTLSELNRCHVLLNEGNKELRFLTSLVTRLARHRIAHELGCLYDRRKSPRPVGRFDRSFEDEAERIAGFHVFDHPWSIRAKVNPYGAKFAFAEPYSWPGQNVAEKKLPALEEHASTIGLGLLWSPVISTWNPGQTQLLCYYRAGDPDIERLARILW